MKFEIKHNSHIVHQDRLFITEHDKAGDSPFPGLELIGKFQGINGVISNAQLSPNGNFLAIVVENSITVHNLETKAVEFIHEDARSFSGLSWSNDGRYLATALEYDIIVFDAVVWSIHQVLIGHESWVNSIFFREDGKTIISGSADQTLRRWHVDKTYSVTLFTFPTKIIQVLSYEKGNMLIVSVDNGDVLYLDCSTPDIIARDTMSFSDETNLKMAIADDHLAIAYGSNFLTRRLAMDRAITEVDAHYGTITGISFAAKNKIIVTKACDQRVKLWDAKTLTCLGTFDESITSNIDHDLSYNIKKGYLITRFNENRGVRIWKINANNLFANAQQEETVRYTTAKIVLVGDSGVGKTGLGWRLSQGEFKEHSSTHGQQFWVVNDLGQIREDGTECEAVLWDLAGQPDYRLVHSLFLDKVNLGLILFDPTARQTAMSSPLYWLKQLRKNQEIPCETILVGSRIDRGTATLTTEDLASFCEQQHITGGYIGTSAKSNEGIELLITRLKGMIPWESILTTVTTSTFKKIKAFVLKLKEDTQRKFSLVNFQELEREIRTLDLQFNFTQVELAAAVKNLENHGYITIIENSKLEEFVLLYPDLIINLASSFILEARRNPKGLGVLEESKLLNGEYSFSELNGLNDLEKETIIDATISLFVKNAICFRQHFNEESFFVFPSLINERRPITEEDAITEDASYTITGAVENVYASLVVLLGYTNTFTRNNQWQNQAEYTVGEGERCGFKQSISRDGEVELTLYHIKDVTSQNKQIFQGLFERFLIRRDITIKKYEPIFCGECNEQVDRQAVTRQLRRGKINMHCSDCGGLLDLSSAEEELTDNTFEQGLDEQKDIAHRRRAFETDLVKMKAILRDSGSDKLPTCFICYAWGNPDHEQWVLRFAKDLKNAGINVLLDKWKNRPGSSISGYIDEIERADYTLVIGTPALRGKYFDELGSPIVAAEQKMVNTILRRPNEYGSKIIPILLSGTQQDSFTPQLQDLAYIDFLHETEYFLTLMSLIGQLFDILDNEHFEKLFVQHQSIDPFIK